MTVCAPVLNAPGALRKIYAYFVIVNIEKTMGPRNVISQGKSDSEYVYMQKCIDKLRRFLLI
jgi:hypothetical protein